MPPPDDDTAKRWADKLCGLLKTGRLDDVLAALRKPRSGPMSTRKASRYLVRAARPDARYDAHLAHGPADRLRAGRGGLQDRRGQTLEMHRNAMDRRREPRPVDALRPPQRLVRRLLGRLRRGVADTPRLAKCLSHTYGGLGVLGCKSLINRRKTATGQAPEIREIRT